MDLVDQWLHQKVLMRLPPRDTFRAARIFISNPILWTQGATARAAPPASYDDPFKDMMIASGFQSATGPKVRANDPRAVMWGLDGALAIVSNVHGYVPVFMLDYLEAIIREWGGKETANEWNDTRIHAEVMRLLDEAAARLS